MYHAVKQIQRIGPPQQLIAIYSAVLVQNATFTNSIFSKAISNAK